MRERESESAKLERNLKRIDVGLRRTLTCTRLSGMGARPEDWSSASASSMLGSVKE